MLIKQKMINRMIKILKGKKTFKLEGVNTIEDATRETHSYLKKEGQHIGRYLLNKTY